MQAPLPGRKAGGGGVCGSEGGMWGWEEGSSGGVSGPAFYSGDALWWTGAAPGSPAEVCTWAAPVFLSLCSAHTGRTLMGVGTQRTNMIGSCAEELRVRLVLSSVSAVWSCLLFIHHQSPGVQAGLSPWRQGAPAGASDSRCALIASWLPHCSTIISRNGAKHHAQCREEHTRVSSVSKDRVGWLRSGQLWD